MISFSRRLKSASLYGSQQYSSPVAENIWTGRRVVTKDNIGVSNQSKAGTLLNPEYGVIFDPSIGTFSIKRHLRNTYLTLAGKLSWFGIETSKGVRDFTYLDAWVNDNIVAGVDSMYELCVTPDWANGVMVAGRHNLAPTSLADFADWVVAVGTRYNGIIKYWYVANEPNFAGSPDTTWIDTSVKYAECTRIASQILKYINQANQVTGCEQSNIHPYWNTNTTVAFLNSSAAGFDTGPYIGLGTGTATGLGTGTTGKDWVDIISIHAYNDTNGDNGNVVYKNINQWPDLRAKLSTAGVASKPLWVSEIASVAPTGLIDEVEFLMNSCVLSLTVGNVDKWFYFYWTSNYNGWGWDSLQGRQHRAVWDMFMSKLFASPIVKVDVLHNGKWQMTQENSDKTVLSFNCKDIGTI